ncbi:DUF4124 domain-containing protein [Lysobacter sp. CFH 32150]|uniref:DUF4124 domain-containing protein n=1 Tax=Lysobacter sp. CFH 32150 TaxID=2927128 RepID=UPI001FA6CF40|nr:DUF4124 domain-containing protein [Lysobacter sp. CFH 32150]MCI4567654.1 DUF4124 domain-containing protein [Lysobacter sp. CFH 32150]
MSRLLSCSLLALGLALVISPLAAQTVYQWKDAKGVTHYSDSPPPKGATRREVQTTEGTPATPQPKAALAQAPTPKEAPATPPAPVADAAQCAQARLNLEQLQSNAPVGLDADSDGKADAELGAADRAKYLGLAREAIKTNCPSGG